MFQEQQVLKLPKRGGDESVRTVQLMDAHTAQKLQVVISEAQVSQQQRRMVKQKSQRFLKLNNKQWGHFLSAAVC